MLSCSPTPPYIETPGADAPTRCRRSALLRSRCGFTITELMVVIGIIVLLVGILLAALAGARQASLKTKTQATMEGFRTAAETYYMEHDEYPGLVPDRVLQADPLITSTENALLAVMGGGRALSPQDDFPGNPTKADYDNFTGDEITFGSGPSEWKIKVDLNRIGEGPRVDSKEYNAYFTPKQNDVLAVRGQFDPSGVGPTVDLPDLVDAWGQPIMFMRRSRSIGPLVDTSANTPQFVYDTTSATDALVGTAQYVRSEELGEFGYNQTSGGGNERYSVLNMGTTVEKIDTWKQVLEHPSLSEEALGAMALFSAGADGVYFSRVDGPGSAKEPITTSSGSGVSLSDFHGLGPSIIKEFDDLRVFGGG